MISADLASLAGILPRLLVPASKTITFMRTFAGTVVLLSAGGLSIRRRCRRSALVLAGAAGEGAADRRSGVGAAALRVQGGRVDPLHRLRAAATTPTTALRKQTPWKHHPWDPNATGQAKACKGAHTYVFKQGVVYRGEMDANESGTVATPIILTRDPSWGTGPAVICGSEAVTGWKQGADSTLIPEPEKVWYVDLDWAPQKRLDGRRRRRGDAHRAGPHAQLEDHRSGRHQERVVDLEESRQAV